MEDVHLYESGDILTQTIDNTHYEVIDRDRQENNAYINVEIQKYVDCISRP